VVDATCTELVAELISRSETKICDGDPQSVIEAEDVLWLQISVVNTERMAIFHSFEQLEKDILDKSVIPKITTAMQDLSEQIMVRSVVHDDVGEVAFLHHAVKGDHTRMRRCELMQGNLSNVDLALTWSLLRNEAFHSIRFRTRNLTGIDGAIDNAITSDTQDIDEF
jgi:hypothetical protein